MLCGKHGGAGLLRCQVACELSERVGGRHLAECGVARSRRLEDDHLHVADHEPQQCEESMAALRTRAPYGGLSGAAAGVRARGGLSGRLAWARRTKKKSIPGASGYMSTTVTGPRTGETAIWSKRGAPRLNKYMTELVPTHLPNSSRARGVPSVESKECSVIQESQRASQSRRPSGALLQYPRKVRHSTASQPTTHTRVTSRDANGGGSSSPVGSDVPGSTDIARAVTETEPTCCMRQNDDTAQGDLGLSEQAGGGARAAAAAAARRWLGTHRRHFTAGRGVTTSPPAAHGGGA